MDADRWYQRAIVILRDLDHVPAWIEAHAALALCQVWQGRPQAAFATLARCIARLGTAHPSAAPLVEQLLDVTGGPRSRRRRGPWLAARWFEATGQPLSAEVRDAARARWEGG
jgi:hypothetical protein